MGKVGFIFSGQGAQYPGMMKDLYDGSEAAKRIFEAADQSLGRSVSGLCFTGTQEELNLTYNTQPCVLAADLAAYAVVTEKGIKPDAVAGFSLGEYAALVASGVIDMEDVFGLVQKRAVYMQEAVPVGAGAMAALGKMSGNEVRELCESINGYVEAANFNCPGQIVVSGETEAVDRLVETVLSQGKLATRLAVSAPFHCKMMAPAVERLKADMEKVVLSQPLVDIYMNVDSMPTRTLEGIKEKLLLQAKSPVLWEQTLLNMKKDGIDTFIEIGPGKTLSGFVKKTFKGMEGIKILRVSDTETLDETLETMGGR